MLSKTSHVFHDNDIVLLMAAITFVKVSNKVTFVVPKKEMLREENNNLVFFLYFT